MFVGVPNFDFPISALFCQALKFQLAHSSFHWLSLPNNKLINWIGLWAMAKRLVASFSDALTKTCLLQKPL